MSNEIAKEAGHAISIMRVGEPHLTAGQAILMELLQTCYANQTPVTKELLLKAYFKALPNKASQVRKIFKCKDNPDPTDRRRICWYEERRSDDPEVVNDSWDSRSVMVGAYAWLRHNLGSCIVKGHLIAIPVIEAE
jgi:hypothetical protein